MRAATYGTRDVCGAGPRKPCTELSAYFASYFADGTWGVYTCARHLPSAVRQQAERHGSPVKVTVLAELRGGGQR